MSESSPDRVRSILFVTLDTLRYDVAQAAFEAGETPNLATVLPSTGWEERHTPATFTYAAHTAFFAGFLPTPIAPGKHERLFALAFPGSETTGPNTRVLHGPDIVRGLAAEGYHTICIGGTGFFNPATPLGADLPGRFAESHWNRSLGVTDPRSPQNQFGLALQRLQAATAPVFLFINVSALHQPNCGYANQETDDLVSHRAALRAVDAAIGTLLQAFSDGMILLMSDHGTCYGEDGYVGHRVAHPRVTTVPFAVRHGVVS